MLRLIAGMCLAILTMPFSESLAQSKPTPQALPTPVPGQSCSSLGGETCNTSFCVHGEIRNHYDNLLGGCGSFIPGLPTSDELPSCLQGTNWGFPVFQHFANATMFWSLPTDSWEFHGEIRNHFYSLGAECAGNGMPVTNEKGTPDGIGRYNHFLDINDCCQFIALGSSIASNRSIYWHPKAPGFGAYQVKGAIRMAWANAGWERGYGYPVTDEIRQTDRNGNFQGAWTEFFATNDDLLGNPQDGAYVTYYAHNTSPYPNPVVTPARLATDAFSDTCYGAQGSRCTVGGIGQTCQNPDANGIALCSVSVGSQLHDSCCEKHPAGAFCAGSPIGDGNCISEFQHGLHDNDNGFQWDWRYDVHMGASFARGPVDLGDLMPLSPNCNNGTGPGHTTPLSIRAPSGTHIDECDFLQDHNWCQSGQATISRGVATCN